MKHCNYLLLWLICLYFKSSLCHSNEILELNDSNFEETVDKYEKLVVLFHQNQVVDNSYRLDSICNSYYEIFEKVHY